MKESKISSAYHNFFNVVRTLDNPINKTKLTLTRVLFLGCVLKQLFLIAAEPCSMVAQSAVYVRYKK